MAFNQSATYRNNVITGYTIMPISCHTIGALSFQSFIAQGKQMYTITKLVGSKWYFRIFIETETPTNQLVIRTSDNVTLEEAEGSNIDGNWVEGTTIDGDTITFGREASNFIVAVNAVPEDGPLIINGDEVDLETIIDPSPKPRTDTPPRPPERTDGVMDKHPVEDWFTPQMFDELFPKANGDCFLKSEPYSHENFIKAIRHFPGFASGTVNEQKKEVAALFAMSVQEVGGKPLFNGGDINFPGLTNTLLDGFSEPTWDDTPAFKWGLYKSCEDHSGRSTSYDIDYPGLKENQLYFAGSGMLQLTYPANFARFSEYYFGDKEVLLDNSDLVRTDGDLAMGSAIFYWMSQADSRPSPHCCFTGKPTNDKDQECFKRITGKGYKQGFAMAICAVNGIECNKPADYRVGTRVNGYFGYGRHFGLSDDELRENCDLETADMPDNLNLV